MAEKLRAATASIDSGTYTAPSKLTVGEWLDIWVKNYLGGVKTRTEALYKSTVANYLKPSLGALKLEGLNAHTIQSLYNRLSAERGTSHRFPQRPLRTSTAYSTRGCKRRCEIGYIRFNPSGAYEFQRADRKTITPLDETEISRFIAAAKGRRYESLYMVTLFSRMRLGEVVGLQWDCVDFTKGTLNVRRLLQKVEGIRGEYHLISPKSGKGRTVTPAPIVMGLLKKQRAQQSEQRLKTGPNWQGEDFVFSDDMGRHLSPPYCL